MLLATLSRKRTCGRGNDLEFALLAGRGGDPLQRLSNVDPELAGDRVA